MSNGLHRKVSPWLYFSLLHKYFILFSVRLIVATLPDLFSHFPCVIQGLHSSQFHRFIQILNELLTLIISFNLNISFLLFQYFMNNNFFSVHCIYTFYNYFGSLLNSFIYCLVWTFFNRKLILGMWKIIYIDQNQSTYFDNLSCRICNSYKLLINF